MTIGIPWELVEKGKGRNDAKDCLERSARRRLATDCKKDDLLR